MRVSLHALSGLVPGALVAACASAPYSRPPAGLAARPPVNEGHLDATTVHFRQLTEEEIRNYVARDKPFHCAGGFKIEALGISLFTRVDSQDPTALIGLPLIWLSGALRRSGFKVP